MKQNKLVVALSLGLTILVGAATANAAEPNPNRVWVKYKESTTGTASARALLQTSKRERLRDVLKNVGGTLHHEFDKLDALVVTMPSADAVKALRKDPDVESVEVDAPRYPMAQSVPYGIDAVQARDVWDANRDGVIDAGAPTGAGIKVCVIDSGINVNHEDFAGITLTGYPTGWNSDTCGHGTHVAGTIAAANNTTGVVGVSPGKVSMHIVKVFGGDSYDTCAWTYSSSLVDAASRCASAGAKIINMSLGGPTSSTTEQTAFQTHFNNGILSIAAAGNDGNNQYSYPASYPSVVSVAAVDSANAHANFSQYTDAVDVAAPGVGVLSTYPVKNDPLTVGTSTFAQSPVSGAKLATASAQWVNGGLCTAGSNTWRNKVVLCQRGTNTFADKVSRAKTARAIGVIIYNNVAGELVATLGEGVTNTIPAVGISMADGQTVINTLAGQVATVDTISSVTNTAYAELGGTSMATPHVVGVAALVWSAKPTATNAQVRDAIYTTAVDVDAAGYDNNTGWGVVKAKDAIAELLQ